MLPEFLEITTDHFWKKRLIVCQPKNGPRCAIDALLLAMAVQPKAGQAVFEAGSGNGIVSLSIALAFPKVAVTGLEIQDGLYALSQKNHKINGFPNVKFLQGDLTQPLRSLKALGLQSDQFDHVVANPPYYFHTESRISENSMIAQAYTIDVQSLERWIRFLASLVKNKGSITLIHRADMLETLLEMMEGRFGNVKIFPIFPKEKQAAKRIILQGVKGSRAPASLHRGLVLHDDDGRYSAAAARVIHDGESLWL